MSLKPSWVASANSADCLFPLNNLPCGVYSTGASPRKLGIALGDQIIDVAKLRDILPVAPEVLSDPRGWNAFMELEPKTWRAFRKALTNVFAQGSPVRDDVLVPQMEATLHMPFQVAEYTDFYAGRHHATNVGTMFRGAENALPPNWLHMPIGYNGRASSVYVSGTDFNRPWGQLKGPDHQKPSFMPSRRFDFELEIGAIVGRASIGPISVSQANENIFGYVLLNDWSARDIQAWEYQPLGPFQAKATATSISPWIVMREALEPFACDTPEREFELLDHLKDCGPMLYDIDLEVYLAPEGQQSSRIARTNYNEMYYSSAQQLAHHATAGSPMNTGDLLGSGTISGPKKENRGSMLELSWGGKEPFELGNGQTRTFLEDGDTLVLRGAAHGNDYKIGFGECVGKVLPALDDPFKGKK